MLCSHYNEKNNTKQTKKKPLKKRNRSVKEEIDFEMANLKYFFAYLIAHQCSFGEGTVNLLIPMHETEKLIGEL